MSKCRIGIVGYIELGGSYSSWFGGFPVTGSSTVCEQIGKSSGDIDIYVNSLGGNVFAGYEISNALASAITAGRAVTFYISPLAASCASYIPLSVAGAKIVASDNAKLMIHAPYTDASGSKEVLEEGAKMLGKMEDDFKRAFAQRGITFNDAWLKTGTMSWFTAAEAKELHMVDEIGNPPADLITAVYANTEDKDEDDDFAEVLFGNKLTPEALKSLKAAMKQKVEKHAENKHTDVMKYAASTEFLQYAKMLCDEHYKQKTAVAVPENGKINVTLENGKVLSLKYSANMDNLCLVNWGNQEDFHKDQSGNASAKLENKKEESEMKDKTEVPETKPKVADAPVAVAKAAALPAHDAGSITEDEAIATSAALAAPAPVAPVVTPAPATASATADALTDDMLAYAKANYQKDKDHMIETIVASKENTFTSEELNAFPIAQLQKIAKLAASVDTSKQTSVSPVKTADTLSTVPTSAAKGAETTGSLPPVSW